MNSIEDINFLSRYPLIDQNHKSNHTFKTNNSTEIQKTNNGPPVILNKLESLRFQHPRSSNIEITNQKSAFKVKTNSVLNLHRSPNFHEENINSNNNNVDSRKVQQNCWFIQQQIVNKRRVYSNGEFFSGIQSNYHGEVNFFNSSRHDYRINKNQQNEEELIKDKMFVKLSSNLILKQEKQRNQKSDGHGRFSSFKSSKQGSFPSYTAMIAQAILSTPDHKTTLGGIYDYIELNYGGLEKRVKGWRNCVRHNLSLNECFVKLGRSRNGRGNDWIIHPSYLESFMGGEYRKRRARRLTPIKRKEFDCTSLTTVGDGFTQLYQMPPSLIRYVRCRCACTTER